jgi:GntR family transcriptional regulator
VLESYSLLAERGAMRIGSESIVTRRGTVPGAAAEALGLARGTSAVIIERVLLLEDRPAAWMQDILRPGIDLPPLDALRDHVAAGRMVMDVLRAHGVPVAYARTEIATRMVTAKQRPGAALGLTGPTAMLELVETMHQADHTPVQWSLNLFRPGRLQLHVMRALPPGPPPHLGRAQPG